MEVLAFMPTQIISTYPFPGRREKAVPERTTSPREEQTAVLCPISVGAGVPRITGNDAPGLRMGLPTPSNVVSDEI